MGKDFPLLYREPRRVLLQSNVCSAANAQSFRTLFLCFLCVFLSLFHREFDFGTHASYLPSVLIMLNLELSVDNFLCDFDVDFILLYVTI